MELSSYVSAARLTKGQDIILHRRARCALDQCVQTKYLSHNSVEEWQGVQLVHTWLRVREQEAFLLKLGLRLQVRAEHIETPSSRQAGSLVAGKEEAGGMCKLVR